MPSTNVPPALALATPLRTVVMPRKTGRYEVACRPVAEFSATPGVKRVRSTRLTTAGDSSSSVENTVAETGTDTSDSLRLRAVTTTSGIGSAAARLALTSSRIGVRPRFFGRRRTIAV